MEEVLAKILALDERAKKVASEDLKKYGNSDAEIIKKAEELKAKLAEEANSSAERETERYRTDADTRIAEINAAVTDGKKALSDTARDNKEKWADEIVRKIFG